MCFIHNLFPKDRVLLLFNIISKTCFAYISKLLIRINCLWVFISYGKYFMEFWLSSLEHQHVYPPGLNFHFAVHLFLWVKGSCCSPGLHTVALGPYCVTQASLKLVILLLSPPHTENICEWHSTCTAVSIKISVRKILPLIWINFLPNLLLKRNSSLKQNYRRFECSTSKEKNLGGRGVVFFFSMQLKFEYMSKYVTLGFITKYVSHMINNRLISMLTLLDKHIFISVNIISMCSLRK